MKYTILKGNLKIKELINNESIIGNKITIYSYDVSGNRKTETVINNGSTSASAYTYDSLNRLTQIVTQITGGERDTTRYTYDNN